MPEISVPQSEITKVVPTDPGPPNFDNGIQVAPSKDLMDQARPQILSDRAHEYATIAAANPTTPEKVDQEQLRQETTAQYEWFGQYMDKADKIRAKGLTDKEIATQENKKRARLEKKGSISDEQVKLTDKETQLLIDKKVYRAARKYVKDNYDDAMDIVTSKDDKTYAGDMPLRSAVMAITIDREDAALKAIGKDPENSDIDAAGEVVDQSAEQLADSTVDIADRAPTIDPIAHGGVTGNYGKDKVGDTVTITKPEASQASTVEGENNPVLELDQKLAEQKKKFVELNSQLNGKNPDEKKPIEDQIEKVKAEITSLFYNAALPEGYVQPQDPSTKEALKIRRDIFDKKANFLGQAVLNDHSEGMQDSYDDPFHNTLREMWHKTLDEVQRANDQHYQAIQQGYRSALERGNAASTTKIDSVDPTTLAAKSADWGQQSEKYYATKNMTNAEQLTAAAAQGSIDMNNDNTTRRSPEMQKQIDDAAEVRRRAENPTHAEMLTDAASEGPINMSNDNTLQRTPEMQQQTNQTQVEKEITPLPEAEKVEIEKLGIVDMSNQFEIVDAVVKELPDTVDGRKLPKILKKAAVTLAVAGALIPGFAGAPGKTVEAAQPITDTMTDVAMNTETQSEKFISNLASHVRDVTIDKSGDSISLSLAEEHGMSIDEYKQLVANDPEMSFLLLAANSETFGKRGLSDEKLQEMMSGAVSGTSLTEMTDMLNLVFMGNTVDADPSNNQNERLRGFDAEGFTMLKEHFAPKMKAAVESGDPVQVKALQQEMKTFFTDLEESYAKQVAEQAVNSADAARSNPNPDTILDADPPSDSAVPLPDANVDTNSNGINPELAGAGAAAGGLLGLRALGRFFGRRRPR